MKGLNRFALLALAVPALLAITAVSTLADSLPSPSGSPSGSSSLPGDPAKGETLYAQSQCGGCHGAALTGGVGPALNPIEKMANVPNSLDANFLIDIITNGRKHQPGDPRQTDMPAKGGVSLTDQDIKDLAAFIIQSNLSGSPPLPAGELAKRTILWVLIGVGAMSFITYLLAQYNMRWIARRAAARNK
jgi:mono/diheme cytochrome c family protein